MLKMNEFGSRAKHVMFWFVEFDPKAPVGMDLFRDSALFAAPVQAPCGEA
jgi:hypothetical protein